MERLIDRKAQLEAFKEKVGKDGVMVEPEQTDDIYRIRVCLYINGPTGSKRTPRAWIMTEISGLFNTTIRQ